MLNKIGQKKLILNDLMAKAVCELERKDCMMKECKQCLGKIESYNIFKNCQLWKKSVIKHSVTKNAIIKIASHSAMHCRPELEFLLM